jgi:hypothetical protein
MICNGFRVSPADYPDAILPRKRLTIGLSGIVPFERPGRRRGWRSGNLGELATLRGRGRRGAPAGPDVAPEWPGARRVAPGYDDPHGAARRGGGGARGVGSL